MTPDLTDRYGAPARWRRPAAVGLAVVLAVVGLTWLGWTAWFHGTPDVRSEVVTFEVTSDHEVEARVDVQLADGVEASCRVRALAEDKTAVGELAFTPVGGRPDPRWGPNDDWTAPAGASSVIAEGANWGVYKDAQGEMHISMLNSLYRPGAAAGTPAYDRVNDMDRVWWSAYPYGVDPLDISQESWVTETDAGAGNDVVIGGLNADIIRLGEGNDIAYMRYSSILETPLCVH